MTCPIAKDAKIFIAGIKLCERYNRQYISIMPTNLYGPNDNYDLDNSHVLRALIRKAHETKENYESALPVWGKCAPKREFLYVDDLAEACVLLMEINYDCQLLNIGSGVDVTIKELAETVKEIVGFKGKLPFDTPKSDGALRKLLDVSNLRALGWAPRTELRQGISAAYVDYLKRSSA